MNEVLVDAARQLESAARKLRRLAKLDLTVRTGEARHLLSEARAGTDAALARMHIPDTPDPDRKPFTS